MCCYGANGQMGGMGAVEMGMEKEVGFKMEIRGIRERLTPGPLTLFSLSLRIQSLSLRTLSLRKSLEQVVHKEF